MSVDPMRKSRNSLQDETAHILSVDMPCFTPAKQAMGRECSFWEGKTTDGRTFTNVEGTIVAVDSRPFKGGKDAVYVAVKMQGERAYIYVEFDKITLTPVPQPGPVLPRRLNT